MDWTEEEGWHGTRFTPRLIDVCFLNAVFSVSAVTILPVKLSVNDGVVNQCKRYDIKL